MKLRAKQVLIPCAAFGARTRLAAATGKLTPIELVALKAMDAGLYEVSALTQFLGLGQRPTLDLIYDFWLKGYVVVDTMEASIRLAGEAAKAAQSGSWEFLMTAENNLQIVPLMQDLVSGAVLPNIGRPHPVGPDSMLVPTLRSGLSLERVTRGELLDAVQREVERQSRKLGRPLLAQEAWVEPEQLLVEESPSAPQDQQRRFLPVLVDVAQDRDTGRLHFDVIDAPDVPPPACREIARGLSILAERLPDQIFFKRLRQEFEQSPATDASVFSESALDRLQRSVQNLETTDPGVVEQRHEQLVELHRDAALDIRARARTRAAVRAIVGYEEHEAVIRQLLLDTERQVVLGNPWARLSSLLEPLPGGKESWFDLLQQVLHRGAQVFLMWGIQPDSKLDTPVRTALADLAARHAGRFFIAKRSSTLHAKFIVRDCHQALVTSYNFLDPPERRDSLEVGLLVEGPAQGLAPTAALDLLEWARNSFPDYQLGQRLLLLPDELGATEIPSPSMPAPPEAPMLDTVQGSARTGSPAIRHWAQAWHAACDDLQALEQKYINGADLIVDREHREALWQALRTCEHRLAVFSDKLSADVVTDRFTRHLRERLEHGASCVLCYRREGASDTEEGPASRLQPLTETYKERFSLLGVKSHAKILVSDDEVTVGSFNFLSYGGDYEGRAGRRERAEISVRVRDPVVVAKVLNALVQNGPAIFERLIAKSGVIHGPTINRPVPPALQPLFRALSLSSDPGETLLRWFGDSQTPWKDLQALLQAAPPEELLVPAVGAALAHAHDLEGDEGRWWRCWLAEQRWRQVDFIGSALFLPSAARGELGLETWLAQLGAAVQAANFSVESLPAASALPAGQAQAAALLLLVAVLEHGRSEFIEFLEGLENLLPAQVRAFTIAARTYLADSLQPLPMALLRRSAGQQRRRQEIEEAKRQCSRALESAESIGFRFPIGVHTFQRLRSSNNVLGMIKNGLTTNDPIILGRYIAELDETGQDVERLMDEASQAVKDEHNDRIEEPKRSVCLKRLRSALAAARTWAEVAANSGLAASDARILSACWTLKRALSDLAKPGAVQTEPLAEPVLRFLLSRLEPLFSAEGP